MFWNHNHSTDCYHLKTFHEMFPATKHTFEEYFENGLSPSEAVQHHEAMFLDDPVSVLNVADRRHCPSLTDVRNLFNSWREKVNGPTNGQEMFEKLSNKYKTTTGKTVFTEGSVPFKSTHVERMKNR